MNKVWGIQLYGDENGKFYFRDFIPDPGYHQMEMLAGPNFEPLKPSFFKKSINRNSYDPCFYMKPGYHYGFFGYYDWKDPVYIKILRFTGEGKWLTDNIYNGEFILICEYKNGWRISFPNQAEKFIQHGIYCAYHDIYPAYYIKDEEAT